MAEAKLNLATVLIVVLVALVFVQFATHMWSLFDSTQQPVQTGKYLLLILVGICVYAAIVLVGNYVNPSENYMNSANIKKNLLLIAIIIVVVVIAYVKLDAFNNAGMFGPSRAALAEMLRLG